MELTTNIRFKNAGLNTTPGNIGGDASSWGHVTSGPCSPRQAPEEFSSPLVEPREAPEPFVSNLLAANEVNSLPDLWLFCD